MMHQKWLKLVGLFGVTIASLLALSIYWSGNNAIAESNWKSVADSAPPGLMAQIQAEMLNSKYAAEVEKMKLWAIDLPRQQHSLYVINAQTANLVKPNANPFCGDSGCAFFAYIASGKEQYQQVWNAYLNVHLPPKVTLFETPDLLRNRMPVLKINQLQGQRVQQLHLTYNGQRYEVTTTLLTPQAYE
jgi:hypothetical protein